MGILLTTDTAFATIAGDELTAAGEFVDGQTTVVGTTCLLYTSPSPRDA